VLVVAATAVAVVAAAVAVAAVAVVAVPAAMVVAVAVETVDTAAALAIPTRRIRVKARVMVRSMIGVRFMPLTRYVVPYTTPLPIKTHEISLGSGLGLGSVVTEIPGSIGMLRRNGNNSHQSTAEPIFTPTVRCRVTCTCRGRTANLHAYLTPI